MNANTGEIRSRRSSRGLPDDDRQGHLHHQRHRARRGPSSSARPASSSSPARWINLPSTSSSPEPSTLPRRVDRVRRRAEAGQGTRRAPAPASVACRFIELRALGLTTTTAPSFLDRFVRHRPPGAVGEGQGDRHHPGRGAIEIYKRARPASLATPDSALLLLQNAFFGPVATTSPGRSLQAQPQARPRDRTSPSSSRSSPACRT